MNASNPDPFLPRIGIALCVLVACRHSVVIDPFFPPSDARGISGIARDDRGDFYAAQERVRELFRFAIEADGTMPIRARVPIARIAGAIDIEAVAFIGGSTIAFGTEGKADKRRYDEVLVADASKPELVTSPLFQVDYDAWQIRAESNEGIEGLCCVNNLVIAASEAVIERNGQRLAPVAVFDLETRQVTPHLLKLTSKSGKISSLACRTSTSGGIDAIAIERHFGTMLVLSFKIENSEQPRTLVPSILYDVGKHKKRPPTPNFEAIEWASKDELILVSDNEWRGDISKTRVLRLRPGRGAAIE